MVDPLLEMDDATSQVRDLYEAFPYPSGPPVMRRGFDARLVLSYGSLERDPTRPIHVLDAGCGTGVGLLAAASLQPDVRFHGVDLNRVGLDEVKQQARRRGLGNVTTADVDLMTLQGLATPPGGFDVIHSSGVIHHLSDPKLGLARLAEHLAPHGIIVLMVYSKRGREHIHPIARALELLTEPDEPLGTRLALGRRLVGDMAERTDDEMWQRARDASDVEFVDRYLHPQETSYDIESLWELLEAGGLKFLRWVHTEDWESVGGLCGGPVLERFEGLAPRERYCFAQEVLRGGKLQLYACLPGNSPRPDLEPAAVESSSYAVHPEGTFELVTRNLRGVTRIEHLTWRDPEKNAIPLPAGPLASAGLILRDQNLPFTGESLVRTLVAEGIERSAAQRGLRELLRLGVLYRPHDADAIVERVEPCANLGAA